MLQPRRRQRRHDDAWERVHVQLSWAPLQTLMYAFLRLALLARIAHAGPSANGHRTGRLEIWTTRSNGKRHSARSGVCWLWQVQSLSARLPSPLAEAILWLTHSIVWRVLLQTHHSISNMVWIRGQAAFRNRANFLRPGRRGDPHWLRSLYIPAVRRLQSLLRIRNRVVKKLK